MAEAEQKHHHHSTARQLEIAQEELTANQNNIKRAQYLAISTFIFCITAAIGTYACWQSLIFSGLFVAVPVLSVIRDIMNSHRKENK